MMSAMDKYAKKSKLISVFMLLMASVIWGVAFTAQSAGMDRVGPFTFSVVRCYLATIALIPCFLLFDRFGLSPKNHNRKTTVVGGIVLGVILFIGGNLQQVGILYTSVAKAGFITSLYIVFVPIAGLFMKKHVHPGLALCVLIAAFGLYFLSVQKDLTMSIGDLLVLGCSVMYTLHILVIDHIASRVDVVRMCCVQFFVFGTLSVIPMLLTEQPTWANISSAWLPLVYSGVLSCCCAYTLQMLAQRNMEPTAVSLLLCPEAMFAALSGWLILGQTLTQRELLGCGLVFSAVVLSQILPRFSFARQQSIQEQVAKSAR